MRHRDATKARKNARGFSSQALLPFTGAQRCRALLATGCLVGLLADTSSAHAQLRGSRDIDSPSRGLTVPGESLTGEASAGAIETNPAQLGFLRAADATWVSNIWGRRTALPGRGHGLFLAVPLGPVGLGLDLADLQGLAEGPAHRWRFSLAFGVALGDRLALGGSWHRVFDYSGGGFSAYDLGASLRLINPLALAVTVEDVNQPGEASSLRRRWRGELLLRPLGTGVLDLAAGFAHTAGDDWSDGTPTLRARVVLPRALGVFAEASFPKRAEGALGAGDRDTLISVGLVLALENLRLRSALLGVEPAPGARNESSGRMGGSFALSLTGVRAPNVKDHVVRLDCKDLGDERRFIGFVLALERAADDPTATAIYVRVQDPGIGLGRIEELRDRFHALRARGKRVFVHLQSPDKRQLYLALAADRIFVHPLGTMALGGFSANRLWWKGALDKVGVRGELVRVAEYKGAMEPFTYDAETDAVRTNTQAIVDDDYERLLATFVAERPLAVPDRAAAEALLARGILLPLEAKKLGLVDEVLDERESEDAIRTALEAPRIGIHDASHDAEEPRQWFGSRVAVVLVEGTISDEEGGGLPMGRGSGTSADKLVRALEQLEHDREVRAVVLRVNSPGGSAFASERIVRALLRLKQKGRPVVVSFGDVAASGGYYVATAGDMIFAEPSTLTGSIGVFAFKIDLTGLMRRFGVFEERASRGLPSEPFSPYHPWTDGERRSMEGSIQHIYQTFLSRVVEARRKKGLDSTGKVDASPAAMSGLVRKRMASVSSITEVGSCEPWKPPPISGAFLATRTACRA